MREHVLDKIVSDKVNKKTIIVIRYFLHLIMVFIARLYVQKMINFYSVKKAKTVKMKKIGENEWQQFFFGSYLIRSTKSIFEQ